MTKRPFFVNLAGGGFAGAVIHYLVAKIFLPVLIGRGCCGWACWTAMILDYLPYKKNTGGRISPHFEKWRYIHFAVSLSLILVLWFIFDYRQEHTGRTELTWLIAGNPFYFLSGIILAFGLKDNRAFCKYLCPITAILKTTARFAYYKMAGDREKCRQCQACKRSCPMDIDIPTYIQNDQRVLSTECILCQTCSTVCPQKNLRITGK